MFALYSNRTGFAGWTLESNSEADFCTPVEVGIENGGSTVAVFQTREAAEAARTTATAWYNADFRTPSHDGFSAEEHTVVMLGVVEG